jgi:hypothetical protein
VIAGEQKKGSRRAAFVVESKATGRVGSSRLADCAVLLVEFLDSASRIDDLLLAGVERMAGRTHFDVQRLLHRRSRRKVVTAGAGYGDFIVCRMDGGFHLVLFLYVEVAC